MYKLPFNLKPKNPLKFWLRKFFFYYPGDPVHADEREDQDEDKGNGADDPKGSRKQ